MTNLFIGLIFGCILSWAGISDVLKSGKPLDLRFGAPIYKCKVLQE